MNANKRSRDEAEHYTHRGGQDKCKQEKEIVISKEELKAVQTQIELINGFSTDFANTFVKERNACYAQLANTSHCTLDLASLLHCESNVYKWLSIDSIHVINVLIPSCVLYGTCNLVEPAFIDTVQLIAEDGELLILQGRANTSTKHNNENGQVVESTIYGLQYSHQESSIRVSKEIGQHLTVGDVILIHPLLELQRSSVSKFDEEHENECKSKSCSNVDMNWKEEELSPSTSTLIRRNVTFLTFNSSILTQQADIDVWQETVEANIQHTQNEMARLLAQPFGLAQMTTIYHELIGVPNATFTDASASTAAGNKVKSIHTNTQYTMECANGWTRSLHLPLLRLSESSFHLHSYPPHQHAHMKGRIEGTLQSLSECIVITLRLYLLIFHTAHTLMPSFALIDYLHNIFISSPLFIDGCTAVLPSIIASASANSAKGNYTNNSGTSNELDCNSSKLMQIATDAFAQVRESLDWILLQQTDDKNDHMCNSVCTESVWLNQRSRCSCDVLKYILAKWSKMWLSHRRVVLTSIASGNNNNDKNNDNSHQALQSKMNAEKINRSDSNLCDNASSSSSPLFIIDSPEHAVYYYWTFAVNDYNGCRTLTFNKESTRSDNINSNDNDINTEDWAESEKIAQHVICALQQLVYWLQKTNGANEHDILLLSSSSPSSTSPMQREYDQTRPRNHRKNKPCVLRTSMYWSKYIEDVLQFCEQPPTLAVILESVNNDKTLINTRHNNINNDDDDDDDMYGSTANGKKSTRDIFACETHLDEMCLLQQTYYPHLTNVSVSNFYIHALRLAYSELYRSAVNAVHQALILVDDAVKQRSEESEEDMANNDNANNGELQEEWQESKAMPLHLAFDKAALLQQNICTLRVKQIVQPAFAPFDLIENLQREQKSEEEYEENKEKCIMEQNWEEESSSLWELRHCALFGCPVEMRAIVKTRQITQQTPLRELGHNNDGNNKVSNSFDVYTNNISHFAYLLVVLQGHKYLFPLVITRFTFDYDVNCNSINSFTNERQVRIRAHVLKEIDLLVDFVTASAALSEDGIATAWVVMDASSTSSSFFALHKEEVVVVVAAERNAYNNDDVKSEKRTINSCKRLLPRSTPALTYFYTIERLHQLIATQSFHYHTTTKYSNNSNNNISGGSNAINTSNEHEWENELYKTSTRNSFCNKQFSVDASVQAILEGRATSVTGTNNDSKSETTQRNTVNNLPNITAESIINKLLSMSVNQKEDNQNDTRCESVEPKATWRLNATQLEVLHTLCTLTLHHSQDAGQTESSHILTSILDVLAVVEGVEGSGKTTLLELAGKVRGELHSAARTQLQLLSKSELKSTTQRLRKTINNLSKLTNSDASRIVDHDTNNNTHYMNNNKETMSLYQEIVEHACENAFIQVQTQKGLQYCGTPLLFSETMQYSNNESESSNRSCSGLSSEINSSCKEQPCLSSTGSTCSPEFIKVQDLLVESYKRCRASPLQQNLISLLRHLSSIAKMYTSIWPQDEENINNYTKDDDDDKSVTNKTRYTQNNIHNTLFTPFLSFLLSSRDVAETRLTASKLIKCTSKEAIADDSYINEFSNTTADDDNNGVNSKCSTWYDYMSKVIWKNCNLSSSFAPIKTLDSCKNNKENETSKTEEKLGQEYWLHRMAPTNDCLCAVTMPDITHLTTMHEDQAKAWYKIYTKAQREMLVHLQTHTHACIRHVCLCLVELIDNVAAMAQSLRYVCITNSFHELVENAQLPLLCKWAPLHLLIDDVRSIPDYLWWQLGLPSTVICTHSMHEPLLLQTQSSLLSTLLLTSLDKNNNIKINYTNNNTNKNNANSVNKFNDRAVARSVTRLQLRSNERSLRHELKHLLYLFCKSYNSISNDESKSSKEPMNSDSNYNNNIYEEEKDEERDRQYGNSHEEEHNSGGCALRGFVSQSAVEIWTHVVPWELNVQADAIASIFVYQYLRSYATSRDRIQVYVPFAEDLLMHKQVADNRSNLLWPFVAEHEAEQQLQNVFNNDVMPICVPFDDEHLPKAIMTDNCNNNKLINEPVQRSYSCNCNNDDISSCVNNAKYESKCNEVDVAIICLSSLLDYLHEEITHHRASSNKRKEMWHCEHQDGKAHEQHMLESALHKNTLSSSPSRLSARERWSSWMVHHSETVNKFVQKLQLWLWQITKETRRGVVLIGTKELFRYVPLLEEIETYVHTQRTRTQINEVANLGSSDVVSTSTKMKTKTKAEAALERYWLSHFAESAVLALRCASHAKCCRTTTITHTSNANNNTYSNKANVTNNKDITGMTGDVKVYVLVHGPSQCKSLCLQPFDHCHRAGHVCIEPCHEIQPIKIKFDDDDNMFNIESHVDSNTSGNSSAVCASNDNNKKDCNNSEITTSISARHAKCPYPCCKMLPCHHICHRTCGERCTPCLFVGLHELPCGQRVVRGMGPGNVIEYAFFAHFIRSPCLAHLRNADGSYRASIHCDLPVSIRCPRCGTKSKVPCTVYTSFESRHQLAESVTNAHNGNTIRQSRGEQSAMKRNTEHDEAEQEESSSSSSSSSKHQQCSFILADGSCAGCVHVYNSVVRKAGLENLPLPPTTYTLHDFAPEVEHASNNNYNYSITQKELPRHLLSEEVRRALDAAFVLANKKAHLMLMKEALELSSNRAIMSQDKPMSEFAMYKAEYEANKAKQTSELQKWNTEVKGSVAEWGTRLRHALDVQMNLNEELESIMPLLNSEAETEGVRQRYVTN